MEFSITEGFLLKILLVNVVVSLWISFRLLVIHPAAKAAGFLKKSKIKLFKLSGKCIGMKTVTIPKEEYERLKKIEKIDTEVLEDIAHGIKDIISGKLKEV